MDAKKFNRILKIIKRSKLAVEEVYRFYYPRIVKRLSAKFGRTLAEDVAQDFFLRLFEICEDTDFIVNPTSWVYACAENIAKRKIEYDSRFIAILNDTFAADTATGVENAVYINELLANLNERERKIIYMNYWEGYSQKEIASILNLKYENVRKIHSRALAKLKKKL